MTVLLKPTCCPASPCSFKNDLPRFTSPPLGLQQREPWQIVARIQRHSPTNKNLLMLVSPSLHIPPDDRFFSPPIIEMIPLRECKMGSNGKKELSRGKASA